MRRQAKPLDLRFTIMRSGYEKANQTIGFTMEIMRCGYEKSSQTTGFTMESMNFGPEKSSRTTAFKIQKPLATCLRLEGSSYIRPEELALLFLETID